MASLLSKRARRYLVPLAKDDTKGSVPFDVVQELGSHGISVQTEHVRHGKTWDTFSYIMKGQEKAVALLEKKK